MAVEVKLDLVTSLVPTQLYDKRPRLVSNARAMQTLVLEKFTEQECNEHLKICNIAFRS